MSMSKDRVKFVLSGRHLEDTGFQQICIETLGLEICEVATRKGRMVWASRCEEIEIVCRPSQFARFLIARNNAGYGNWFKELKPELVPPDVPKKVFDVSKNPNSYWDHRE